MLAYVLALVVGLGSFALYMAAFFFPEVHRKNDFIWSGIGLFYALVLWVSAGRITGGVLLGQVASVTLLGWLAWETIALRRKTTPLEQQTPVPTGEEVQTAIANLAKPETLSQVSGQVTGLFSKLVQQVQGAIAQVKQRPSTAPGTDYVPPSSEQFGSAGRKVAEQARAIEAQVESALAAREAASQAEAAIASTESACEETSAAAPVEIPLEVETAGEWVEATVEAEITPTLESAPVSKPAPSLPNPLMGTVSSWVKQGQAAIQKFTQKPESKPVYVRKQYREQAEDFPEDLEGLGEVIEDAKAIYEVVAEVVTEPTTGEMAQGTATEATLESAAEPAIADLEPGIVPEPTATEESPAIADSPTPQESSPTEIAAEQALEDLEQLFESDAVAESSLETADEAEIVEESVEITIESLLIETTETAEFPDGSPAPDQTNSFASDDPNPGFTSD